jgi:hypothetical protein
MHRYRAPSIAPGTFFVAQSWADFIINMSEPNLRQAQPSWAPSSSTHLSRRPMPLEIRSGRTASTSTSFRISERRSSAPFCRRAASADYSSRSPINSFPSSTRRYRTLCSATAQPSFHSVLVPTMPLLLGIGIGSGPHAHTLQRKADRRAAHSDDCARSSDWIL